VVSHGTFPGCIEDMTRDEIEGEMHVLVNTNGAFVDHQVASPTRVKTWEAKLGGQGNFVDCGPHQGRRSVPTAWNCR